MKETNNAIIRVWRKINPYFIVMYTLVTMCVLMVGMSKYLVANIFGGHLAWAVIASMIVGYAYAAFILLVYREISWEDFFRED